MNTLSFLDQLKENTNYVLKVEPFIDSGMTKNEMFEKARDIIEKGCIEASLKGDSSKNFCCYNLIKNIYPGLSSAEYYRIACAFAKDLASYLETAAGLKVPSDAGTILNIKW